MPDNALPPAHATGRAVRDGDFVERDLVSSEVRGQRDIVFRTLGDAHGDACQSAA
jgi:hypothetical protein